MHSKYDLKAFLHVNKVRKGLKNTLHNMQICSVSWGRGPSHLNKTVKGHTILKRKKLFNCMIMVFSKLYLYVICIMYILFQLQPVS